MSGLLAFHQLAAMRGDGLHPLLRQMLEQRAAIAGQVVELSALRPGMPAQAGPNPPPREPAFRPGNVIGFDPAARAVASAGRQKTLLKK